MCTYTYYHCVLCEKIARSRLGLRHKIEFSNGSHIGVDVSSESWKLRMLVVVFYFFISLWSGCYTSLYTRSVAAYTHYIHIYFRPPPPHRPQHSFIIIIITTITFFSLIFPLQVISICFINLFQRTKKVFLIFPPSGYCCRLQGSLLATKPI